jgi:hypothetical protein
MRDLYLILAFVVVVAGIAGGAAWYLIHTRSQALDNLPPTATTESFAGEAIYTNGTYGFVIRYPETADVTDTFTADYHLPPVWRTNTSQTATGTPIVAVVGYDTRSDHSYPRYFHAMVRIGASADSGEVSSCEKITANRGETALPDTTINGTVFKTFAFQDAGMMQYVKGVSYRAVHEGKCFAIEKIQVGSSYREDPPSAEDVSDEELQKQYANLDKVVASFTFVRP